MVIISEVPLWKLLNIICFQSSQQFRGTLTTAFEMRLPVEDFTDMDQHNSFLGKYHKTKMDKVALEIISCTKFEPVLWRTLH